MNNKEYAAVMRDEASKWADVMPVSKELWLQIADRIQNSPDPLAVQQANRENRRVLLSSTRDESNWFHKIFFSSFMKKVE